MGKPAQKRSRGLIARGASGGRKRRGVYSARRERAERTGSQREGSPLGSVSSRVRLTPHLSFRGSSSALRETGKNAPVPRPGAGRGGENRGTAPKKARGSAAGRHGLPAARCCISPRRKEAPPGTGDPALRGPPHSSRSGGSPLSGASGVSAPQGSLTPSFVFSGSRGAVSWKMSK